MKFLADENIEKPIVDNLRSSGHEVLYVSEIAPASSDDEVLQLANSHDCILLTNDKDFGELIYRESRISLGIILLRFSEEDGRIKARILEELLPVIINRLLGHFTIITEERIRIKPLRN